MVLYKAGLANSLLCTVIWWVESGRSALSLQLTIVLITYNTGLFPCLREKVWRKLAAEDRQEFASGGKEKTQGASVAQAEVSPFRAGSPRPHLKRQGSFSLWWRASLIGHRCRVPHACLCAMRAGMGCWLSMPNACPHSQGRLREREILRHSSWPPQRPRSQNNNENAGGNMLSGIWCLKLQPLVCHKVIL